MDEQETIADVPDRKPRRFGAGALVLVAILSAAAAAGGVLWVLGPTTLTGGAASSEMTAATPHATEQYVCPMHPTITQDHPETCPICGMDLVPVEEQAPSGGAVSAGERHVLFYRSPMDAKQTSPTPRKDEMGMDYLPVYDDELSAPAAVPGLATVTIDAARQQLIGLKTTEVKNGPVSASWQTTGRVAVDETRVRHVNTKVPGFVERIDVDFVGKKVRKGDPLFSLFSPELLAAQREYLLALKTERALSLAGGAAAGDGAALVEAARHKLAFWDVPESTIRRIAETGEPERTLTFYSPAAGVVTKKDVVEGMRLEAGAMPFEIVDLSSVWVLADVSESQLGFAKVGTPATLKLKAFPNRELKGTVVFVDPMLEPRTRTVKVRLAFPNPTGDLRPEMFGEVTLRGTPREALQVPVDAVIDSGAEKVVFVARGEGRFEPRVVTLGASDGTNAEVLSGLAAGDHVVTRANFLVDSESRLRASLAGMASGSPAAPPAPESARVLPSPVSPGAPSEREPATPSPGASPHEGHGR